MKKYAQFIKENMNDRDLPSWYDKVYTDSMYDETGFHNLDGFERLLKKRVVGNYARFFDANNYSGDDSGWMEMKVVDVRVEKYGPNVSAIYFIDEKGKEYFAHAGRSIYVITNKEAADEAMEKRRKKKEEMFHKMKDVDPYGEEDWMDEGFFFKKREKSASVFDSHIDFPDFNPEEGDICIFQRGENGGTMGMGIDMLGKKCEIIKKYGSGYSIKFDAYQYEYTCRRDNLMPLGAVLDDVLKKRKEKKLKMMDIDPYGEENWDDDTTPTIKRKGSMGTGPG
jgi:hypothetical protein